MKMIIFLKKIETRLCTNFKLIGNRNYIYVIYIQLNMCKIYITIYIKS